MTHHHNLLAHQHQLVAMLKIKGTGATMGKHLDEEQLALLTELMQSSEAHLTTKATLLTAMMTLEKNQDEQIWLYEVGQDPHGYLGTPLACFFDHDSAWTALTPDEKRFLKLILKVIHGQDLDQRAFSEGLSFCFDPDIAEYLKAAFLEAERLKRETLDENLACLNGLVKRTHRTHTSLPVLIDIANPYDGYSRTPNLVLAVAAVLGATGYPTVVHGVESIGPKYGATPSQLLTMAGKNPLASADEALNALKTLGWAYLDQAVFSPELFALKPLRKNMVKRPVLATMEKFVQPIKAKKTILVTSYTHPPYKKMLSDVFSASPLFAQTMIVRGVEGGTQLPLDRKVPCWTVVGNQVQEGELRPQQFGFEDIPQPTESGVEASLAFCLEALNGTPGWAYQTVVYQAAAILTTAGLESAASALEKVTTAIAKGQALNAWKAGTPDPACV
ncbi:MAG: anthranilate phosphoribosyltransferase [Candidatus Margulisiibacteriota bacterium]